MIVVAFQLYDVNEGDGGLAVVPGAAAGAAILRAQKQKIVLQASWPGLLAAERIPRMVQRGALPQGATSRILPCHRG